MKIAIIGTGSVGSALGRGFAQAGHEVAFGVRDTAKPEVGKLVEETGARAASVAEAASGAEVVVLAPGFRIPRIAMHRCSASTTTIAPRGSSLRISASAIWLVRRSWTCGRLAYMSTTRANFDKPVTLPLLPGMYPTCATP